ncbi:MAG: prepilin-type N-terminal cleavage/methylation domain-containing protein [Pseudomonadota bacterium]|nr:prepilin-type N-terminal cleavage/methylation domain-containing protein [Pseudomonadota bacterium]
MSAHHDARRDNVKRAHLVPRSPSRSPSAKSARGFGLVELMVALALGLVVVGGASVLFVSTRQASTSTENLSRIQESTRTGYDLMVREIREAGGTPCDSQVLVSDVLNGAQSATPDWWATWGEPVRGFTGATAFDGVATGAAVGERVAGTGAILVRYAERLNGVAIATHVTGTRTFTTTVLDHGVAAGDLLLACNYSQAAIFQASAVNTANGTIQHALSAGASGNCGNGLGLPTLCTAVGSPYEFSAGSQLGRFVAAGWYIGNNGRAVSGGRSLYRITRDGPEEVADGVTDLQTTFLVTGAADYVVATAVTDWATVLAARIDLTFEGPDAGVSTVGPGARLHRVVSFTANFRNLLP